MSLSRNTGLSRKARLRPFSRKRAKARAAYVAWANERRQRGCDFWTYPPEEHLGPADIHHIVRGKSGQIVPEGDYAVLCRSHHDWVHAHPKDATVLGLLRSQFGDAE